MHFNFARPDVAFCVPWLIVLTCYLPLTTVLSPVFDTRIAWMLGFNMLSAPLILFMVNRAVSKRLGYEEIARPILDPVNAQLLHRFTTSLFLVWLTTFAASVVFSGGLPIIWSVTGDVRTYSDFGIPTVGGLSILLRSTTSCLVIFLFLATRKKVYLAMWAVMMADCVFELSRSALFMLACQSLCTFLLLQTVRLRQVLMAMVLLLILVGAFIGLGSLRGIEMSSSDFGIEQFGNVPLGFYWAWSYIVSPLGNINHAASLGITPSYLPLTTFVKIVPTAVLNLLGIYSMEFPIKLISPSLNATSMYGPLLADFGFAGAALFMAAFQTLCSYAYVMARRGSLMFIVFYPALFGSLVLSIFFIYATSLPIVLVPLLVVWLRRFVDRRRFGQADVLMLNEAGARGA